VAALLTAAALAASSAWGAGPGSLDTGFSDDGWATVPIDTADSTDIVEGLAVQRNGKLVAAGYSGPSVLHTDVALARFKPDGSLDHGFSGNGTKTVNFARKDGNDAASDVAVQGDGKIVVTGFAAQSPNLDKLLVARFRPSGRLDPSFSGDGQETISFPNRPETGGQAVAVQHDGRILVAGSAARRNSPGEMAVARLTKNGGLDPSFSGDGRQTIEFPHDTGGSDASDVALRHDGTIVVGGLSARKGEGRDFATATLNADGTLDRRFSHDGRATFGFANGTNDDEANALALGPHGETALAGAALPRGTTNADFGVLMLERNGTPDGSFSGDGRVTFGFHNPNDGDFATGVAFKPQDRLVVGGISHQGVHGNEFALARLDSNGQLDPGFGQGGRVIEEHSPAGADDDANAMAVQRDGKIVLGGASTPSLANGFDFSLARFRNGPGHPAAR
jgi:uncharacterized delta-60 repeat protein